MRYINLAGQKFGQLTVLERIEKQIGRNVKFRCKCDCGNETVVAGSNLKGGSVQSCGHHRWKNLTGARFGRLVAIRVGSNIQYKKHSKVTWVCKCDCNDENEIVVPSCRLLNGETQSCGCYKKDLLTEKLFTGYLQISGSYWGTVQAGAKKRGLEFSITKEDVWDLYERQNRTCALSGISIEFCLVSKDSTASIDRIDNKKGYTLDNIQIVHKRMNIMKNNMTQSEFREWCSQVSGYTTKQQSIS